MSFISSAFSQSALYSAHLPVSPSCSTLNLIIHYVIVKFQFIFEHAFKIIPNHPSQDVSKYSASLFQVYKQLSTSVY